MRTGKRVSIQRPIASRRSSRYGRDPLHASRQRGALRPDRIGQGRNLRAVERGRIGIPGHPVGARLVLRHVASGLEGAQRHGGQQQQVDPRVQGGQLVGVAVALLADRVIARDRPVVHACTKASSPGSSRPCCSGAMAHGGRAAQPVQVLADLRGGLDVVVDFGHVGAQASRQRGAHRRGAAWPSAGATAGRCGGARPGRRRRRPRPGWRSSPAARRRAWPDRLPAARPCRRRWGRCARCSRRRWAGRQGMRPCVGFRPMVPVKAAGMRIEPPASLPMDRRTTPAATAARSRCCRRA